MDGGYGAFSSWSAGRNQQGLHFSDQQMDNPRSLMDNSCDPIGTRFEQGFGMRSSDFHLRDRPLFRPDFEFNDGGNPRFERNIGWQNDRGNPFWDRPMRGHGEFSGPFGQRDSRVVDNFLKNKRKRRKTFIPVKPIQTAKGKSGATKTPQQPKITASQPAKPGVKTKETEAQNGDAKKSESAGKAGDDDGKNPPNKKLKTEETTPVNQAQSNDLQGEDDSSTTFTCNLCRFHTKDEPQLQRHFNSNQHREIIKYLYIFLPRQTVDFIQEYLFNEKKKVSQEQKKQNLHPPRDSFKGIGQEHFFHRIEVAHCLACDILIPDVPQLLLDHIKSEPHTHHRKMANKEIKSNCIMAAKALLQEKNVLELLDKFNKGKNPFKDTADNSVTQPATASHEVLVAEEDDYAADDDDNVEDDDNHDEDPVHDNARDNEDPAADNEDPAADNEDPSHDVHPQSEHEMSETDFSNEENVFITLDIDGTVDEDEEEAAEAP